MTGQLLVATLSEPELYSKLSLFFFFYCPSGGGGGGGEEENEEEGSGS